MIIFEKTWRTPFPVSIFDGILFLLLLLYPLSGNPLFEFQRFQRENAPESRAPMPPSSGILQQYSGLSTIQKYFFLESYFHAREHPISKPTILVNASESQIQNYLNLHPVEVIAEVPERDIYAVRVPNQFTIPQFLDLSRQSNPGIHFEENDLLILNQPEAKGGKIGDHLRSMKWSNTKSFLSTNLAKVPRRIKVGILDSGISPHYDLPVSAQGEIDENGHGTHVAGIVSALQNNDRGIDGMTELADLKVYKILNHTGAGSAVELISALVQAQREGCHIINLSVGSYRYSKLLFQTLTDLARDGIIMIAAAGNESTDKPSYPASHPFVLGVGSYKTKRQISEFSNFGNSNLMISLPGENIISTYINEQLKSLSGTSMAAPMLTGIMVEILARLKEQPDPGLIVEIFRLHRAGSNAKYGVQHAPLDFELLWKLIDTNLTKSGIKEKPKKASPGSLGPSFPRQ